MATYGKSFLNDSRYREASQLIQQGAWDDALRALNDLANDYPDQSDLLSLIDEIQTRAHVEQEVVVARSPISIYLLNRRRVTAIVVGLLAVLIVLGGWTIYSRWVEPSRQARRQQVELARLIVEGETALAERQYERAIERFSAALKIDPNNASAAWGLERAQHLRSLDERYNQALALMRSDPERALSLLQEIEAEEPGYRDTAERIKQIHTQQALDRIFEQAEDAYRLGRWEDAIKLYESIRSQDVDYRAATIEQRLFESYRNRAGELLSQPGTSRAQIQQAMQFYRQALTLRPKDKDSRLAVELLGKYLEAQTLMDEGKFAEASILLSAIHSIDPNFLNGDNRRALYDALVGYGAQLENAGDLQGALTQYQAAANLPGVDTRRAQVLARLVALALTPTPTPTPTLRPTPTPGPQQTPTPVILPLESYLGWIAFHSDRPGSPSGLWVMRPDGSGQRPVLDPNRTYEHLEKQAKWSSDNTRRIWVEADKNDPNVVSIYMWRYDVPPTWSEARVELLNNSALNYQVAFAPNDEFIVFTSQHTKGPPVGKWGLWGDEIFLLRFSEINSSGYVEPHRLTFNDWEWDKHPTVSPDSQQIAFWSNRITGRAQIWLMNVDGSNQHNLSRNEWNDWDPIFVVKRREIPNLDKNNNPIGPLFDPNKQQADP